MPGRGLMEGISVARSWTWRQIFDAEPTLSPVRNHCQLMVVTVLACNFWLILATAGTGTFTYTRFHIPRAPTAPAMAPAAGAGPGGLGLGVKLTGPE